MVQRNLRRHPRQVSRIPARVELHWGVLEGRIENIGEGGLFFVTDTLEGTVEPGMVANARFRPEPEGEVVSLSGEILRVDRTFDAGEILRTLAIRFHEPWRPD